MTADFPPELTPKIVEGEVVQLRSGGQMMTIEEVGENLVACVWFEKGTVRRTQFPPHVLKRGTDAHMILRIEGFSEEGSDA